MGRKCCVPGCKSGKNVPSHRFPKDPERCSKWIKSLKLDHFKSYTSTEMRDNKVCHKHFRLEDYSPCLHKRFLLNIAVPVPLVINDSKDIASNNMQNVLQQQQQSRINIPEYEKKEQHNQNLQCANNKDMLDEKDNIFEKRNATIIKYEKLDCNQKACESSVLEQLDKIDSILQNYERRLQTLEAQMETVMNAVKKRQQLQKISQCNLGPISQRLYLYKINMKLKRRNKYLKYLVHKNKQQKKRGTVPIVSSISSIMNDTAAV